MRPISLVLPLTLAALAPCAQAEDAPVRLVPHRVVYELSLASSQGARTVESARGRIVFEQIGNACEGYALNFRQVTSIQSGEAGEKLSDLRTTNYESGDGRTFRFRNETRSGDGQPQIVDGSADRKGDTLTVRLKTPKPASVTVTGAVTFPNAQMRDLIVAARAGKTTLSEQVFDGSDDGRKVYETLAVIGKRAESEDGLEAPVRQPGIAGLARWPVSVSYFTAGRNDGTPVYILSFDLYENGVSRALKLDYGDFALKGEMTKLDFLPDRACGR